MTRPALLLLAVAACGHAPAATAPARAARTVETVECEGESGVGVDVPSRAIAHGFPDEPSATVQVLLRNCTPFPARARVRGTGSAPQPIDLAPHERRAVDVRLTGPHAKVDVTATYSILEPRGLAGQRDVELVDADRARAIAECRACRGDWGPQGIHQLEGCTCRARDAGKVCHDADDCEGDCVASAPEVVARTPMVLARPAGRCSERIGAFGCVDLVPHGASLEPPRALPLPVDRVCRD